MDIIQNKSLRKENFQLNRKSAFTRQVLVKQKGHKQQFVKPQRALQEDLQRDLVSSLVQAFNEKFQVNNSSNNSFVEGPFNRILRVLNIDQSSPYESVPGPQGEQALNFLNGPVQFLEKQQSQYNKGTFKVQIGGQDTLIIGEKNAAKQVFIEKANCFQKEGTAFFPNSSIVGKGLLVSDGDLWKRQRRITSRGFRKDSISFYTSLFSEYTQEYLKQNWDIQFNRSQLQTNNEQQTNQKQNLSQNQNGSQVLPQNPNGNEHQSNSSQQQQVQNFAQINQSELNSEGAYSDSNNFLLKYSTQQGYYIGTLDEKQNTQVKTKLKISRDVYQDMNNLTLFLGLKSLFSETATSDQQMQITQAIKKAFEYFTKLAGQLIILPEWFPSYDNMQYLASVRQLDKIIFQLIHKKQIKLFKQARRNNIETIQIQEDQVQDVLGTLVQQRDEEDQGYMQNQNIRDELMTMLVASQETTAILLGWVIAILAYSYKGSNFKIDPNPTNSPQNNGSSNYNSINMDLQTQLREEIFRVVGYNQTPNANHIQYMPRLQAILLETLRLYPPAFMVGRCANKDVQVGDVNVKQGTTVLVSPYLLHRNEQDWPRSNFFEPQRWLNKNGQLKDGQMQNMFGISAALQQMGPNQSYVPFGAGPRVCIGTAYGFIEACIVMAIIIQKYSIKGTNYFPEATPLITLRPKNYQVEISQIDEEDYQSFINNQKELYGSGRNYNT